MLITAPDALTSQVEFELRPAALHPPSSDERSRLVECAAYYLALERGFTPGHEAEDWARAESIVALSLEGERFGGD
jgi:hypothetical protein